MKTTSNNDMEDPKKEGPIRMILSHLSPEALKRIEKNREHYIGSLIPHEQIMADLLKLEDDKEEESEEQTIQNLSTGSDTVDLE